MKKLVALLSLTTAPAFAADIVEYIPPPPAPIVIAPSWTGLYIGGQAGYAFHSDGSGGLPGAFIQIPGIPMTPGTPADPGAPEIPATPGSPEIPGTPGSPEIVVPAGVAEFSFACAGVPAGGACAGAIEVNGVATQAELTLEQISAAFVAIGGDPADLVVVGGSVSGVATTPGTVIPAVPPTDTVPAVPPTPGSPAVPPTPAVPGTSGTPDEIVNLASLPGVSSFEDDSDGFIGGIHIGYDRQLGYSLGSGALVLGALADLSYVDVDRYGGLRGFGEEISVREELDYLATLRLRAGVGFERALVYATGGLAFGSVDTTFVNTVFDDFASDSDTRVGYAVGGGVDFLVAPNFSIGVEYLYTDLGDGDGVSRSYDLGGGTTLNLASDEDFDFHTVWAKASFRFN